MMCEDCGKNPAKIHMTEIINENEKREYHLCEKCAQEKGFGLVKQHFSLSELLAGITAGQLTKAGQVPDVKCPSCGTTLAQFNAAGRFGCPEDYDAFAEHIRPRLEKYHDATRHTGKTPRRGLRPEGLSERLRALRAQLKQAVEAEAYERAAEIRDELKQLQAPGRARAGEQGRKKSAGD